VKAFPVDLNTMLTVAAAVVGADGALLEANRGFLRLLPADRSHAPGSMAAGYFIQPSFATLVAAIESGQQESYRGLMTIGDYAGRTRTLRGRVWRTATGIRVLAEFDIVELEKLNDAVLELNQEFSLDQQALTRDNVSLKQREQQSTADSLTDALTGIGNRRRLDQALATEIVRARRSGGALSVIMADIDHFKRINDEYGHAAGDKVLAGLGALLQTQARQTDIAARFGGEEFIVLLPHTALAPAMLKAEKLRKAIAAIFTDRFPHPVTSSFGVAELSAGEDSASLLRRADAALYQAKQGGRNRVIASGQVQPA
jgi:two-component system cell cycle response regulator